MDYFNQESERLIFRKMMREDIPTWMSFFIDNEKLKYVGVDITLDAETLATQWVEKQLKRYADEGLGHLAVLTKEGGNFIGVGGILPREFDGKREYEVSYSLIPKYWNKGYGTEIARQMRTYGFQNVDSKRLISIIDKANTASINVAKKNGMHVLFETIYLGLDVFVFGIENDRKAHR